MAEHLAGLRQSAAEVAACGDLPRKIPVVILSAATQSEAYRQEHARMAARSAHGRHVLASGSGHWILLDEPELVVEAIRHLIGLAANSGDCSAVKSA
jgi:pimeloyl-ACP methyl ester carboxylesterase